MKLASVIIFAICSQQSVLVAAEPKDLVGDWRAKFSTEIGVQKYLYDFRLVDGKLVGKALSEIEGEKHEVELQDAKVVGDTVSFFEVLTFERGTIRIDYTGKMKGDNIEFTRYVGAVTTENFVAKRQDAAVTPAPDRP